MGQLKDLTNQEFGDLTVIERLPNQYTKSGNQKTMWKCQCSCGKIISVCSCSLLNNSTKSCGHNKQKDITNQKFGKLTAKYICGQDKWKRNIWLCECECGNTTEVMIGNLTSLTVQSCGCNHDGHPTHKQSKTRLYNIWQKMKNRCYDSNTQAYKDYGGRGINVCDEWKNSFVSFQKWALSNGYQDNLTIERKDNNGNYCPQNCMWANRTQQGNNKRNNIILTWNNKSQTISQWANELNISASALRARKHRGWDDVKTLTTPIQKNKK